MCCSACRRRRIHSCTWSLRNNCPAGMRHSLLITAPHGVPRHAPAPRQHARGVWFLGVWQLGTQLGVESGVRFACDTTTDPSLPTFDTIY